MKKLFFLLAIVSTCMVSNTFGQTESTDKYYYVEVILSEQLKGVYTITSFGVDFPTIDEKKDEMIKKLEVLKNGVDILNYMSDLDWVYVDKQVQYIFGQNQTSITKSFYTFRKIKQKK